MAGGGGGERGVGVGGVGRSGVKNEVGPVGDAVGGDLDAVAGDGEVAVEGRGGPGEVDPVAAQLGRAESGGLPGDARPDGSPDLDLQRPAVRVRLPGARALDLEGVGNAPVGLPVRILAVEAG